MASAKEWEARVAAWRQSGLTSARFCEGRDFTAGGLRHWSYRVAKKEQAIAATAVTVPKTPAAETPIAPTFVRLAREAPDVATSSEPIVVELGAVRVSVRRGFDSSTLGAVLDLLVARSGR